MKTSKELIMKTLRLTAVVMTVLFMQNQVNCGGWFDRNLDEKHVVANYLNYTKDHLQGSLRSINLNAHRIKAINKRARGGGFDLDSNMQDMKQLSDDMTGVNRELESMYSLFVRVIRKFSDVEDIQGLDTGFKNRVEQFKSLIENKARDFTSITNLMNLTPRPTPHEINYLIELIQQAYKLTMQAQQNYMEARTSLEPMINTKLESIKRGRQKRELDARKNFWGKLEFQVKMAAYRKHEAISKDSEQWVVDPKRTNAIYNEMLTHAKELYTEAKHFLEPALTEELLEGNEGDLRRKAFMEAYLKYEALGRKYDFEEILRSTYSNAKQQAAE